MSKCVSSKVEPVNADEPQESAQGAEWERPLNLELSHDPRGLIHALGESLTSWLDQSFGGPRGGKPAGLVLTGSHASAPLCKAVTKAEAKLRRAPAVPRLAAENTARATAHATIDIKAMHEGKAEVLWTLNGGWLKAIRWNRKSVTVDMAGERDTIPHAQVGGAR